ncbi:MAG: hypothetical protein H0V20_06450 [Actinobacteria bacterium]|nr:hypothetical protein [Actinomycetota bacterium]
MTLGAPLTLLFSFVLIGCGGGGEAGAEEGISVELEEEDGSGQSGTATLTSAGDGRSRVAVTLSNPPDVPQPSHVHSGRCGDMGDPVAGLESLEGGEAETVIELSLAELQTGNLVVQAHKSDDEYDVSVACGEIPTAG